jgi:hypothetical protein
MFNYNEFTFTFGANRALVQNNMGLILTQTQTTLLENSNLPTFKQPTCKEIQFNNLMKLSFTIR